MKKAYKLNRSTGFFFENLSNMVSSQIFIFTKVIASVLLQNYAVHVYAQLLNGINHCSYVMRSPIWYGFHLGIRAIHYSVNMV